MDEDEEHLSKLERRFMSMPFPQVLAFCCCCCERTAPSYRAHFEGRFHLGRDVVDTALRRLWAAVDGVELQAEETKALLADCGRIQFAADNDTPFARSAEAALGGIMSALTYYLERSSREAGWVAHYSTHSIVVWVDLMSNYYLGEYGSEIDDAALFRLRCVPVPALVSKELHDARDAIYKAWLRDHPMVTAERSKQLFDLAILASVSSLTPEIVAMLRESSQTKGVQPYLRGLAARRLPEAKS